MVNMVQAIILIVVAFSVPIIMGVFATHQNNKWEVRRMIISTINIFLTWMLIIAFVLFSKKIEKLKKIKTPITTERYVLVADSLYKKIK
ncbi:MAG: hypothetical protein ABIP51_15280 [Bacteroidia bacterium]